jgi:Cu+-exporting ATPase
MTPDPVPPRTTDLPVLGITCASCVRRVERALRAVPGVHDASVNFATSQARVDHDPRAATTDQLIAAIEAAGYASPRPAPAAARAAAQAAAEADADRAIRRDLIVAVALTVPLVALAMSHGLIPGTGGVGGRLAQLALATPVVFGPGRRFLRQAWAALRHRAADMSTLVSMGVLAAWGYSTVGLVAPAAFPHAGHGAPPHLYSRRPARSSRWCWSASCSETGAPPVRRGARPGRADAADRARARRRRRARGADRGAAPGARVRVRPERASPRTARSRVAARRSTRRC